ncbi:MAG: hypothetical protein AAF555_09495 [Verrucomicrobiota bacterium]
MKTLDSNDSALGPILSFLLLRMFLGFHLFLSGITKWKSRYPQEDDEGNSYFYSFSQKEATMKGVADTMIDFSGLPAWMVNIYASLLPYAFMIAGLAVLVGAFPRIALALGGVIYFSLAFGLLLLPDDQAITNLTLYIAMSAGALALVKYNRFSVFRGDL